VIGERAGRHEDRPLFAERARERGLELLDDPFHRVAVGRNPTLVGQASQQARIL
jgi:hypothetical protein